MISKETLLECLREGIDDGEYIFIGEDIHSQIAELSEDEIDYIHESCEALAEDELAEGAGVLSGIPKHIVKTITGTHQISNVGGENSSTSVEHVKAKTAAHVAITKGLQSNSHVIIKKDGKVLASIHPVNYKGANPKNIVQKGDEPGAVTKEISKWVHGKVRYGRYEPGYEQKHTENTLGRAEAIQHIHNAVEAAGGYKGGVEIHHIGQDANRAEKAKERHENRSGYVNTRSYNDKTKSYTGTTNTGKGKASDEKSLLSVTKRAAEKLANKYDNDEGPKAKAMELHAAIGKAIESGDHREVRRHMDALTNHLHQHGMNKSSFDKERVVGSAVDLAKRSDRGRGGYNYDRDAFVKGLRKLKGQE